MMVLQKHVLAFLTTFPEFCSFSDLTRTFYSRIHLFITGIFFNIYICTCMWHRFTRACEHFVQMLINEKIKRKIDEKKKSWESCRWLSPEAPGFPTAWPSCYTSHQLVTLSRTELHAFNQLSSAQLSGQQQSGGSQRIHWEYWRPVCWDEARLSKAVV